MTCAPAGTCTCACGPTSVMRSPERSTVWSRSIWPDLLSNKRPARIAITRAAGAHWWMPPSAPTQGAGPAPRHGAGGG